MHPKKVRLPDRTGRQSFALVATLALLAVATILLVLFVSTTTLDRSASYSYSQSIKADQIGLGGLHLVVGQLQAEMYKDGLPDYGPNGTNAILFTNVTSYNILPQANVTNASLPALIKMSTNAPFFSGTNSVTAYDTGLLQASTNSSTSTSLNGRSVSTNVWNQIFLGQYPNSAAAPYWVIMTRGGPTNASGLTFGTTGNTLNNAATANTNYAVGRIAYAIYDEGGLLDINAAGYPGSGSAYPLSSTQLAQIKGTLAGADLSQIPGITPSTFISWRNTNSAASAAGFVNYVTNFASSNGFMQVYAPTSSTINDSTFLSRQDLILAAETGTTNTGLTTNALPYLATFTRELNAPSWAPSLNGVTTIKRPGESSTGGFGYANNALNLTSSPFKTTTGNQNPNPLIPFVRYTTGGTVTGYHSDGTTYTYTVNVGDPVVQHRFPLDRLNWIGPSGPNAAAFNSSLSAQQRANAIQACFGLYFGASENIVGDANWTGISVWKYVGYGSGATSSTKEKIAALNTSSAVETLTDVGNESSPREPNFFELLQAGVLSGSLALTTGSSQTMISTGENYPTLQLLRIGASIISQVQAQAYPINVEYNQNDGGNFSVVASGVANLPYLNTVKFITGQSPTDSGTGGKHQMGVYGLFGLWNPHQQPNPATSLSRPQLAMFLQGSICAGSGWSTNESGYSNGSYVRYGTTSTTALEYGTLGQSTVYGEYYTNAPNTTYLPLSTSAGVGANGFLNPYPITSADIGTPVGGTGSSTTPGWTSQSTPALSTFVSSSDPEYTYLNGNGINFVAFELPDLDINLALTGVNAPQSGNTGYDSNQNPVWLGNPAVTPATSLPPFQLILKYKDPVSTDPAGSWVPYDYLFGYNSSSSWPTSKELRGGYYGSGVNSSTVVPKLEENLHSKNGHSAFVATTDPRTMRFGTFAFSGDNATALSEGILTNAPTESLWSGTASGTGINPNTSPPFNVTGYGGGNNTGIPAEFNSLPTIIGSTFFLPAHLSRNNYANTSGGNTAGGYFSAYADPDGIQRIADSGLFSTSTLLPFTTPPNTGNPYYDPYDVPNYNVSGYSHRTADRPIILNRPFNNVGELGYVFRDSPWRSLDFFSVYNGASTSPDSGLLDLFSVTDDANTVVAGRVNLNTRNASVLTAILNGTLAYAPNAGDTLNNTSVTSLSNPSGIATALTNFTQATAPLVNKDQLVTQFGTSLGSGTTLNSAFGSLDEQNVKPYREAFVRSLSSVGQTRTWNLLIDLVAQSGKYPPTATNLNQFEVDGVRHYWLHVAIDRFTGKVIDRQLELIGP